MQTRNFSAFDVDTWMYKVQDGEVLITQILGTKQNEKRFEIAS